MMRITTPPLPHHSTAGARPRFYYPSQKHLTPKRCSNCHARLLLSEVPTAESPLVDATCIYCSVVACELAYDGMRRPMTPEEWKALPSEQPKLGRPPRLCASCAIVAVKPSQERCRPCWRVHLEQTSNRARLAHVLADGRPKHRAELCLQLGMTADVLGATIQNARLAGRQIAYADGFYTLEGQP